jgi:hypothetical protein
MYMQIGSIVAGMRLVGKSIIQGVLLLKMNALARKSILVFIAVIVLMKTGIVGLVSQGM